MTRFATILAVVLMTAGVATANGNHDNNSHGDGGDSSSTVGDISATVGDISTSSSAGAASSALSGSSSVAIEHEASAASPGALILGTCQAGLTAQTQMGGGSMGGPEEVCLLFTLAQMQAHFGDVEAANATLDRAETILKWRGNIVRRAFQAIPLLGRIF